MAAIKAQHTPISKAKRAKSSFAPASLRRVLRRDDTKAKNKINLSRLNTPVTITEMKQAKKRRVAARRASAHGCRKRAAGRQVLRRSAARLLWALARCPLSSKLTGGGGKGFAAALAASRALLFHAATLKNKIQR